MALGGAPVHDLVGSRVSGGLGPPLDRRVLPLFLRPLVARAAEDGSTQLDAAALSAFFKRVPARLGRKQAPIWLWAYAVAVVVETALRVALHPLPLFLVPFALVSPLVAWLVLRGGRVAWCWAIAVEGLGVAGLAWGEPWWSAALSAVLLACLLAPASRAYVWREAMVRRQSLAVPEGWGARIASGALWDEVWSWVGGHVLNWNFIRRFFVATLLLVPVVAVLSGARDDGGAMAVLYRVVAISFRLALVSLMVLLIAMGIRALVRLVQPKLEGGPPR